MASANASLEEDSFLTQLDIVRVELTEIVSRAHQVLEERETALMSELQELEDGFRGEQREVNRQIDQLKINREQTIATLTDNKHKVILEQSVALMNVRIRELEANLETARDKMSRVALEWDESLEGMLGRTGSIRVSGVPDNKEKRNSVTVVVKHTKIRQQVARPITEDKPIRGLKNLGNTCFMNSVLQCLSHTLPLRQFYVSDEYKQYLNNRGDLSNAFKRVMVELWGTTSNDRVDLNDLMRKVRAITSRFPEKAKHNDHEFMRFLLNELHEEINRASVEGRKSPADNETLEEACARYLTWEDSRISELFGGMLRSDVCCSVCSNQSTVYIPFMDISLSIPERKRKSNHLPNFSSDRAVQLAECLNMLTIKDTLDEEERPYCEKCNKLATSTKQLSIAKLPRFLIIQLKRFSYYPKCTKLSKPVKFDETWKLVDSCNEIHTYSLYGIVSHSGSILGGYYTAYCNYNGVWRCFNDTMVRDVCWKYVKHQEAYILFYEEENKRQSTL